jgi:hypothetical protein
MPLIIKLAQNGNSTPTNGRDKVTLKAEVASPLTIRRSPTLVPLPGGSILGIDLGKNIASLDISGVVDEELTELFVDNKTGDAFVVDEIITGTSGWNTLTSPPRETTPTATIKAGIPSLAAPTSLIISNLTSSRSYTGTDSDHLFFVDNEPITGAGGGQAIVNQPFPTKIRMEQIAKYWYSDGVMTLTTVDGDYEVFITGMNLTMQAGLEDRYNFKISFGEAVQGLK